MFTSRAGFFTKIFLLSALLTIQATSSFAHRIEFYSSTGCTAGSTVTVGAYVTYAPSNTYYNWQYKDNTGTWKFFAASSTINGSAFTVSGFQSGPAANLAPTLTIANATTVLEGVQVRCLMAENVRPINATASTQVWGGDDEQLHEVKTYRIRVYSNANDCGSNTPGCIGNVLKNSAGYYGGFENKTYSNNSFTDSNFGSGIASSEYANGNSSSATPGTSAMGTYTVWNNPYTVNNSNTRFAPKTGNYQLILQGAANTQKKAWYKTVSVNPAEVYTFSVWVARTQGTNAFNLQLKAGSTVVATGAVNATIGNWVLISGSYTVPAGTTSVEISIADVSTAAARYYSLDDICFRLTSSPVSLGNRVFYDTNNNGIDNSEEGMAGLTVKLYRDANGDNVADGAAIATTTTDANGYYAFTGQTPGNYIVGVTPYSGYISSGVNGGDPDNNVDGDDNGQVAAGTEIRGLGITLTSGGEPGGSSTNNTYDFGFLPDCACAGAGANLLVNPSFENGNTGWTASGGTLTTGTGYMACGTKNGFNNTGTAGTISKVYQDITLGAGATFVFSAFSGIHQPGLTCSPMLSVIFLNASNGVISQQNVAVTQNVTATNGQLAQYSITGTTPAGTVKVRVQASTTCNTMKLDAFCFTAQTPVGKIGDLVWNDVNGNGLKESNEPVLTNVTVKLYLDANNDNIADGASIATTTTNGSGIYTFSGLSANNYIVGVTLPAGYQNTLVNGGDPDNNLNNDNNGMTTAAGEVRSMAITLTPGSEPAAGVDGDDANGNLTLDFGLIGTGRIGDFVFNDYNRNGVQDPNETGISRSPVSITYPNGNTASLLTGNNGEYQFANLYPGNYTLRFETPTFANYMVSPANAGSNDNLDSDPVNGNVTVSLAPGEQKLTVDAGFYRLINLYGNVFNDANGNADNEVNSTSPAPLPVGLIVYLVDNTTGLVERSYSIGPDGTYRFLNILPTKAYRLVLSTVPVDQGEPAPETLLPTGWRNTGENLGAGPDSGDDGIVDGLLYVNTGKDDIFNANFGIRSGSGEIIVG